MEQDSILQHGALADNKLFRYNLSMLPSQTIATSSEKVNTMRQILMLCALVCSFALVGCGGTRFMEPGARIDVPPAGKALVNIHRPSTAYGGGQDFFVWRNQEIVGNLHGQDMFQVVVDPGKQTFHAKHLNVSVIKAELAADKTYDIVCDCGPNYVPFQPAFRLWLNAITPNSDRRGEVKKWMSFETTLVLSDKERADREKYQAKKLEDVQKYLGDFTTGEKQEKAAIITPTDGY